MLELENSKSNLLKIVFNTIVLMSALNLDLDEFLSVHYSLMDIKVINILGRVEYDNISITDSEILCDWYKKVYDIIVKEYSSNKKFRFRGKDITSSKKSPHIPFSSDGTFSKGKSGIRVLIDMELKINVTIVNYVKGTKNRLSKCSGYYNIELIKLQGDV